MGQYEQLRDELPGPAGDSWRQADAEEARLRQLYTELNEDGRYTDEYKSERAWAEFLKHKDRIIAGRKWVRDRLQRDARSAEKFSIPMPQGVSHKMEDANELLAAQHEYGRVTSKINRLQGGPVSKPPIEVLKQEYSRGLETGGVEGAALCRGVLMACGEHGVSEHAVVDEFRKDHHRESLERARQALVTSESLGTRIQAPPFPKPASVPPQSLEGVLSNRPRRYAQPPTGERPKPPWVRQ